MFVISIHVFPLCMHFEHVLQQSLSKEPNFIKLVPWDVLNMANRRPAELHPKLIVRSFATV